MNKEIKTSFNEFTQKLLRKGQQIISMEVLQQNNQNKLLLNIASQEQPAVFDWNKQEKRWFLVET